MVMRKFRFIIVGSGWRSLYYVRIAKALPDVFEMGAMLCRTEEKVKKIEAEQGIHATTSIEECVAYQPDFVVVAVSKPAIAEVSMEWMERGFTVLSETPAGLDLETLYRLWEVHRQGKKQLVAEQYFRYPICQALEQVRRQGIIGKESYLHISLAHEYHGASLIRMLLHNSRQEPFSVSAKSYRFPTVETLSRYERFQDGHITDKPRTLAAFEFANNTVALYEFDSEQYRSPIRQNYVKLQGIKGEIKDNIVCYLDEKYDAQTKRLKISKRKVATKESNPNLQVVEEITEITFDGKRVYTPPFGLCGLSEDETAMAEVMRDAALYARGEAEPVYELADALQDAYMAILLRQAVDTGKTQYSEIQPWCE